MVRLRVIFEGFAIRLPNGWEVPGWAIGLVVLAACSVAGGLMIWAIVRVVNRRTKLPPDRP